MVEGTDEDVGAWLLGGGSVEVGGCSRTRPTNDNAASGVAVDPCLPVLDAFALRGRSVHETASAPPSRPRTVPTRNPPRFVVTSAISDSSTATTPAGNRKPGRNHSAPAAISSRTPMSSADTPPNVLIEMTRSPSLRLA